MTALRSRLGRWLLPESLQPAARELAQLPRRLDALETGLADVQRVVGALGTAAARARGVNAFEFRSHSQNGEDGILLYLFTMIGTTDRRFVEIGVEDGRECNTANLSLNFGWTGLLLERNEDDVRRARKFYAEREVDVRIEALHVTQDNVNEALVRNGVQGEIDLLSIDIDGNDYWVWESIDAVRPRIVVIEYNASLGWERPIVVPYDPNFSRFDEHESGFYHGASLAALEKLGNRKGYCLVGCELAGVNSFFVRRDCTFGRLSEVPVDEAYVPIYARSGFGSSAEQFDAIKHLAFVEV